MRIFRRERFTQSSAARRDPVTPPEEIPAVNTAQIEARTLETLASEESDVFVCRRDETPETLAETARALESDTKTAVTLFVYGWHNVEPGPLSWVFPSLRAALNAARAMRNAMKWCIVSGTSWTSMEDARDGGAVLIEQLG